jgi:hypothetical protein
MDAIGVSCLEAAKTACAQSFDSAPLVPASEPPNEDQNSEPEFTPQLSTGKLHYAISGRASRQCRADLLCAVQRHACDRRNSRRLVNAALTRKLVMPAAAEIQ